MLACDLRSNWAGKQLLQFVAGAREVDLIAIRHAKLDAFGTMQPKRLFEPLTIHPDAVAAAEVFENTGAVPLGNLNVVARDAAVAEHQMVVRRAPDAKRERVQRDTAAAAV